MTRAAEPTTSTRESHPRPAPGVLVGKFRSVTPAAAVLGATFVVLLILHPELMFRDSTPTGGDLGGHVWGPAYLRDVLLPNWQLSGWSMDWYAGFPAYRFYMVLPALAVVALDLLLPYGVALKLVAVSGVLALPLVAWLMGRIARLAYPLPELMAVGSLLFLVDESHHVYGGNIASAVAGEFSFSISLALSLLALGFFARGLENGTHRAITAVLVALTALSHGIVMLFVFAGAAVMTLLRPTRTRLWYAVVVLGTAVLLSAFWVIPFLGDHAYMTDMKYPARPNGSGDSYWAMFFPLHVVFDVAVMALALAGFAGSLLRRRFLGIWMGVMALLLAIAVPLARESLPGLGLLWNPRILPFLYLLRFLLAAIGVYEILAGLAHLRRRAAPTTAAVWSFALPVFFVIGFSFQVLPFASASDTSAHPRYGWGELSLPALRSFSADWARSSFTGYEGRSAYPEYRELVETMREIGNSQRHGCGRALWERSDEIRTYGSSFALTLLPYWTNGCITTTGGLFAESSATAPYAGLAAAAASEEYRAFPGELRYETNNGEITAGYMEDLGVRYLMVSTPEAVTEAERSDALVLVAESGPWHIFELPGTTLVEALTTEPVVLEPRSGNARENWLEVGTSWFQNRDDWPALPVEDGPSAWNRTPVEIDLSRRIGEPGRAGRRVDVVTPTTTSSNPLEAARVDEVVVEDDRISFRVDRVGVPVLVKVSYFPGWEAEGAEGPYRAAPNFMVVVPTEHEVTLTYARRPLDTLAWALTLTGLTAAVVLALRARRRPASPAVS